MVATFSSSAIDFLHLSDAPARAVSRGAAPGLLVLAPCLSLPDRRPSFSGDRARFRDHADRMARTLLEADRAARAQFVDVLVTLAWPELSDRILRTGAEAAVALEAVAAGQAALRLIHCFLLVQPMHHLFESGA